MPKRSYMPPMKASALPMPSPRIQNDAFDRPAGLRGQQGRKLFGQYSTNLGCRASRWKASFPRWAAERRRHQCWGGRRRWLCGWRYLYLLCNLSVVSSSEAFLVLFQLSRSRKSFLPTFWSMHRWRMSLDDAFFYWETEAKSWCGSMTLIRAPLFFVHRPKTERCKGNRTIEAYEEAPFVAIWWKGMWAPTFLYHARVVIKIRKCS